MNSIKAPNVPLDAKHLSQLEYYMEQAEQWLKDKHHEGIKVSGHLIGSLAPISSKAQDVVVLRSRIKKAGPDTAWKVRDFINVLEDTEAAHREILEIHNKTKSV